MDGVTGSSSPPSTLVLADGADFELHEEVLGQSPKGTLYRGIQKSASRPVAIRILPPSHDSPATLVQRLGRHAEILARLESEGIVPILGAGLIKDKAFYAMELVQGESLMSCVKQAHRFTTIEILHIATGIVSALRAVWKSGIAHCGLKPTNIFLTPTGTVRVSDAGVAGGLSEVPEMPVLSSQGRYVAPEQLMGEAPDVRSDIYSLGVILYELSTRKLPFEGYDSATSFYYQLMHVDPVSPRELGASIPRELERAILRCMAKAPSDRYPSPEDLLQDIEAVREHEKSSAQITAVQDEDTGDFDIFEDQMIGEGGMGVLYRGRQQSLGRPVAIKVIRDVFTANPDFVQRFRQEAELLAQVSHANVVQVFGTGTWRGRLFYAMELVEGKDVATRLREKQQFSPEEVLHVAEGVARALAAAWKFRIVHRDIKPSNILLPPDGSVKVADFGLAKSLRIQKSDSRLIAGTSEYISPEQGMGVAVDIRSDIYSLGVVLYELLAGRPPFKSDGSFTYVIYQHVHAVPPALEALVGSVPPALAELIRKCLQKKKEDRFQTPEELLSAILRVRSSLPTGSKPKLDAAVPPSKPAPPRRKLPMRAVAAAFLVLAVAAGIVMLFRAAGRGAASGSDEARRSFELNLALGSFDEAKKVAAAQWGISSKEYRLADLRKRRSEEERLAVRGRECLSRRDWSGSIDAWKKVLEHASGEGQDEARKAIQLSQDLLKAEELEKSSRNEEAVAIYRRYLPIAALRDELQARISRLTR